MKVKFCIYELNKDTNIYSTNTHGIVAMMPGWKYCPYCGGNILVVEEDRNTENEIKKAE